MNLSLEFNPVRTLDQSGRHLSVAAQQLDVGGPWLVRLPGICRIVADGKQLRALLERSPGADVVPLRRPT